ncbi:tudor domain-containing protein 7-like [Porites lutea]|uniref:tudor domain-containing protein 7-like n=1 Tax=Porites lutea TaxID=51062 RepID=UPI003CC62E66
MEELKKKTEAMLRAVLISSPRGVPLRRLNKEYSTITYSSIPHPELGFPTLDSYIKSIPHVAALTRDVDGEFIVKGVASESDQHVAKLIAKQRKPKKRSKGAANPSRRPQSRRPTINRPLALNRPIGAANYRPVAVSSLTYRAAARHVARAVAKSVTPVPANTNTLIQRPTASAAAPRSGVTNRFVPPRMMKQAVNKAVSHPVNKTSPPRGFPGKGQENLQEELSSKKFKKKKPKSSGGGPNWQQMEVTFKADDEEPKRVISLSDSSASEEKDPVDLFDSLNNEDLEIFSRIRDLLENKPKGLWLKRIGAEYKKLYNQEISSEKLETLRKLPTIARCEEFAGGNIIVYPPKPQDEKPPINHVNMSNGVPSRPVELYTLRPQDLPAMGTVSEVTVIHVDSPSHFFVQHNQQWEDIEDLSTKLNKFFQDQSSASDTLPSVEKDMFCCAQFTEDDGWYRARIVESPSGGDTPKVHVIYVDFGNHETLPVSRLRMLRKEHAELPMMSVLCALEGVTPPNGEKWSAASIARFRELCTSETLKMKAVKAEGNHLYVQLRDASGCDVIATMKKEGHAKGDTDDSATSSSSSSSKISSLSTSSSTDSFLTVSSSASSLSSLSSSQAGLTPSSESGSNEIKSKGSEDKKGTTRPFLRHRFLSRDEEVQKIPERVQVPEDENFLDVFVCNIHSTDNICVNLSGEEYSEKLTALEQSMLCHYEEPSSEEMPKIVPGCIFAIYSKEIHSEGLWYRVKVLKVKGDTAHIEYLDYGDTGHVPTSNLRSIPSRFLELPFQALTISLSGLPKTKNAEVILKLKQMTLNRDLVAEVINMNCNTVSVELWDTSNEGADININRLLRSLVIPDEEMVPVLPKPGEQIDAYVTFVTLEGHIFIQIPGGGTTRLDELMNDISEHYSQPTKAAEFVSSPQKDKIVCAKCSDGAWYRAVVSKVLPDRQVEVKYVDYGNTEELPISSLRQPTRSISHVNSLPFQALECRLEGTEQKPLTEDQAIEITERNVLLEVVEVSDVPIVRLFIPSEEDEQALVNLGELIGVETKRPTETQDALPSNGNDDAVSESLDDVGSVDGDSVTSESSSESSKSPDEAEKLSSGVPSAIDLSKPWVDISLLECEGPGLFMFQCLELLQQHEELEEKIQEYYTNKVRTPFREIKPGVLCGVLNTEDNTWYRAVIKTLLSPQQICVRFADYGDFGIVPSSNIQALPDEFRQLPHMAVQGCLHGVEPVGADDLAEWSEDSIRRFVELTVDKKLVAKPKGVVTYNRSTNEETKISLELYDTSGGNEDVRIADVLVSEGLARKINES